MKQNEKANGAAHPIAVVGRRTGLSPDVLRVWERRYGAVAPFRTATGRRLYSDEDLARLQLLRDVTRAGRRIGDVATLATAELRALVDEDRSQGSDPRPVRERITESDCLLREASSAVDRLDAPELKSVLSRALVTLHVPEFVEQVVAPLLTDIGLRWQSGLLSPVQERVATNVIRQILVDALASVPAQPRARRLAVATPSRQVHDLGAYLAALAAAVAGWRVTVLGSDLPAEDIALAANRSGFEAVALSIVFADDTGQLDAELRLLRRALHDRVRILVGGAGADLHRATLKELGAVVLRDTRDFADRLDR